MKKKTLLMFLISVATAATLGAAGCEEHEHSWVLKSDDNYHWQECEKEDGTGCGSKKDFAAHVDANHDGECDTCEKDVHIHSYEWKHDEDKHWQECVLDDSEKLSYGGHVDLINNDTQADGKDGLCDTCGLLSKVVATFDMKGIGTAPASQKIDYGTKVTKPADPDVQGYIFDGWYKDEACENVFDFTADTLTADTVLYANFTDDETEGMSAKYALDLVFESQEVIGSFGKYDKLYFKYTAEEAGRYSVTLNNTSSACSFTTDQDAEGVTYEGTVNKNFDLDAGESIVVVVLRGDDVADDADIGAYVSAVTNEDLPDSWQSGEYRGKNYTIVLDKENKNIKISPTMDNNGPVSYNYIGGKTDTLTFTFNFLATGTVTVTRVAGSEDKIHVVCKHTYMNFTDDMTYYFIPEPIEIAKFSGLFVPKVIETEDTDAEESVEGAEGADDSSDDSAEPETTMVAGISQIGIYENGNGFIVQEGTTYRYTLGKSGSTYDEQNVLTYGTNYMITANLDDEGNVVSINVECNGVTGVYVRSEDPLPDEVPEKLPLTEGEYVGGSHILNVYSYGTYLDNHSYQLIVTDYVKATNTYTLTENTTVYTATIEGTGADVSITLKDSEGNVVATLTPYVVNYHDLPAASKTETIAAADLQKGKYYFYTVKTEGWYAFTSSDTLTVSYGLSDGAPEATYNVSNADLSGAPVYLEADTVVRVTVTGTPASVSFTVAPAQAPVGMTAENPHKLTDACTFEIDELKRTAPQHIEFTAPSAGKYIISCTYTSWGSSSDMIKFVVDDTPYGYNPSTWRYYDNKTAELTLTAGQKVKISVDMSASYEETCSEVKLKIAEDYTGKTTALLFDNKYEGSLSASGIYGYALNEVAFASSLTLTSEDEFTLVTNGEVKSGKEITLTVGQVKSGFKLTLAEGKSLTYKVDFLEGANLNHAKVDKIGTTEYTLTEVNNLIYVDVTAPSGEGAKDTVISLVGDSFYFTVGETKYGYALKDGKYVPLDNTFYKLAAGEKVTIVIGCLDLEYEGSVALKFDIDLTVEAGDLQFMPVPVESDSVVYVTTIETDATKAVNVHFDKDFVGNVLVSGESAFEVLCGNGTELKATLSNGIYKVTLSAVAGNYYAVTSETEQILMVATTYTVGTVSNPYVVTLTNGAFTTSSVARNNTIYLTAPAGTYVYSTTSRSPLFVLNGEEVTAGQQFTVKAGDSIVFTNNGTSSATVKFTLVVPEKYDGAYEYGTGESKKVLTIEGSVVTIESKDYTLTSVNGDEYTFTNGTGDAATTVTLTLGESLLYGETALTYKPVIDEDKAGTYVGEYVDDGVTYYIVLKVKANGKLSYALTIDDETTVEEASVTEADKDGVYAFDIYGMEVTFKFNSDGTVTFTDEYLSITDKITLSAPKPAAGTYYKKFIWYDEMVEENFTITLTVVLSEGLKTGTYLAVVDEGSEIDEPLPITVTEENGVYSFEDENKFFATGTFTYDFDSNSLVLEDDLYGHVVLAKR